MRFKRDQNFISKMNSVTKMFGCFCLFLFLISCTKEKNLEISKQPEEKLVAEEKNCSISNPYSPGSGKYAGFEWASENDPSQCGGNSSSFIEGCEEYLDQKNCRN